MDEKNAAESKPDVEQAAAKRRLVAILHADIKAYSRLWRRTKRAPYAP
jgi:class 3 adenylate cyclase